MSIIIMHFDTPLEILHHEVEEMRGELVESGLRMSAANDIDVIQQFALRWDLEAFLRAGRQRRGTDSQCDPRNDPSAFLEG
jgi:hypothetical protein